MNAEFIGLLTVIAVMLTSTVIYTVGYRHGERNGIEKGFEAAPSPEVWLEAKKYEIDKLHDFAQEQAKKELERLKRHDGETD